MTHGHAYEPDVPCVELSPDVCIREIPGRAGSFTIAHDRAKPEPPYRCEGTIPVTGPKAWGMTGTLTGGDLTLTPSVRCIDDGTGYCGGSHGWVRDGKWVPA